MGLRGRDKKRRQNQASGRTAKPPHTVDTLIGEHAELVGDVHFGGGLHLDGCIKGNVTAIGDNNAALTVGESASIEGDVRVPHVVLNGSIEGDVHACERITLSPKARVSGNVHYRLIEMAGGAMVNGQLIHAEADDNSDADAIRPAVSAISDDLPDAVLGAGPKGEL